MSQTCPCCNGNDADAPCAYPGEGRAGCLRDARLERMAQWRSAKTPDEKRALAAWLAEHDPDMLADIKALAKVFGPFEEVAYLAGNDKPSRAAPGTEQR